MSDLTEKAQRENAVRLLANLCPHGVSGGCERADCVQCAVHGYAFIGRWNGSRSNIVCLVCHAWRLSARRLSR